MDDKEMDTNAIEGPEPVTGIDDTGAPKEKREQKGGLVDEVIEWAKSIVIALMLALIIKSFFVQAYMIPTSSMEPTIMPRDRVFGNRFVYRLKHPQHGDIIAFEPPDILKESGRGKATSLLKRVVAVGGDTVAVRDGILYLNGIPLDEPYIKAMPRKDYPLRRIPEGYLFMMGDNRNNSLDSRVWGLLPEENIQAKAFFRFWPPARIGVVR